MLCGTFDLWDYKENWIEKAYIASEKVTNTEDHTEMC